MDNYSFVLLFFSFMLIAFLYASVGHAGASGYLAIMALFSFPIVSIKPVSLVLNIVVSIIATYKFLKAGYFDKKVFLSFAVTSIPFAFLGGYITIDPYWFKISSGFFLIFSALLLIGREYIRQTDRIKDANPILTAVIGAFIGLISGLFGVGGGVFLSPIIIILGYAPIKSASGIAALFILCNSVLGLAGNYLSLRTIDMNVLLWIIAVSIGGYIGAHLGSQKFHNRYIIFFLFLVLISAGLKFILVG
jgi:uncharacterized protein